VNRWAYPSLALTAGVLVALLQSGCGRAESRQMSNDVAQEHPVTVRVIDAESGKPVAGVKVAANKTPDSETAPVGETDSNGEFHFTSTSRRTQIKLTGPNNDAGVPIGPAPGSSFEEALRYSAGRDQVWQVRALRHPERAPIIQVRGRVVDEHGMPIVGAAVAIQGDDGHGASVHTVTTNWDGAFWGSVARKPQAVTIHAEKDGKRGTYAPSAADMLRELTVVAKSDATSIAGTIVDEKGTPLPAITVRYDETFADNGGQASRHDISGGAIDAQGRFLLSGLSPQASYLVHIDGSTDDDNHAWYGSVELPGRGSSPQAGIHIKSGEQHDIGKLRLMAADSSIAGTVVDSKAHPVAGLAVEVHGDQTTRLGFTDKSGRFSIDHVVREPLVATVYRVHGNLPTDREKILAQPVKADQQDAHIKIPG